MRLLYIRTHKFMWKFCVDRIVMKHGLMIFLLLICSLISSCVAIQEVMNGPRYARTNAPKDTLNTNLSPSDQISPVKGKVINPFGYRGGHNHTGSDIKLQKGDTVRAAFSGVVTKASPNSAYGNLVILKHVNNIETYYAHLSKCLVQVGDSVVAGEVVGLGGHTGRATTDHLHFEVRYNHISLNPEHFFDFNNNTVKIFF